VAISIETSGRSRLLRCKATGTVAPKTALALSRCNLSHVGVTSMTALALSRCRLSNVSGQMQDFKGASGGVPPACSAAKASFHHCREGTSQAQASSSPASFT